MLSQMWFVMENSQLVTSPLKKSVHLETIYSINRKITLKVIPLL